MLGAECPLEKKGEGGGMWRGEGGDKGDTKE